MWRRRFALFGLLGVLFAGLLIGWHFYSNSLSDRELQDAIAEADRLDPGWRLEELEAKRAIIPSAENSAQRVLAIKRLLTDSWPPHSAEAGLANEPPVSLVDGLLDLPPELQLNAKQTQRLRAELEKVKEPLAKARSLAYYRAGRYAVNWLSDYKFTCLPCLETRDLTSLLTYDARLRAQDGDIDGALISVLSILTVGRSIGDEPHGTSQFIRMYYQESAIDILERTLAQGQASANSLANVQRDFEDEVSQPLLLFSVRGERAGIHHMMEAIESGELKGSLEPEDLVEMAKEMSKMSKAELAEFWAAASDEMNFARHHAPLIRVMTQVVEIAKLPVEQQRLKLKSYLRSIDEQAANKQLPAYVAEALQIVERGGDSFWWNQAWLRCAICALAAERYRIAYGHWPDSLNSLVPEFLTKIPLDPFDAKPLRYGRLNDGVVIYSVGLDEKDDGGTLDRQNLTRPGTDFGFQLWDVNRRRQPWLPAGKD